MYGIVSYHWQFVAQGGDAAQSGGGSTGHHVSTTTIRRELQPGLADTLSPAGSTHDADSLSSAGSDDISVVSSDSEGLSFHGQEGNSDDGDLSMSSEDYGYGGGGGGRGALHSRRGGVRQGPWRRQGAGTEQVAAARQNASAAAGAGTRGRCSYGESGESFIEQHWCVKCGGGGGGEGRAISSVHLIEGAET